MQLYLIHFCKLSQQGSFELCIIYDYIKKIDFNTLQYYTSARTRMYVYIIKC